MTIKTMSKFYYGHKVTVDNQYLDFSEGQAILNVGNYSLTDFVNEVARALNEVGSNNYVASVDRTTRLVTISGDSTFELYPQSGVAAAQSAYELLGFDVDKTGSNSYEGDSPSGDEYSPQFLLQSYIDKDDNQKRAFTSVNKSAKGIVETVSFGTEKFYEFNITFATDIDQGKGGPIETNLNGVADLRAFMVAMLDKPDIEFIPDRDSPSNFTKVIIESTPESKNGTDFKLKELYSRGLAGYFQTGILNFREVL